MARITVAGVINLVVSILVCALYIFVSSNGGTFGEGYTTGGGKPTPGARIYHK